MGRRVLGWRHGSWEAVVGTREGAGKNDSMEKDLIRRILFNV